jgi:hypothetical protein
MPFVTKDHRESPDENIPGDRCFLHYNWMMQKWRESPRWTTADLIYAKVKAEDQPSPEWQRAKELAWQVLFIEEIMDYERKKKKENGAI